MNIPGVKVWIPRNHNGWKRALIRARQRYHALGADRVRQRAIHSAYGRRHR